jgi:hypothetical protein
VSEFWKKALEQWILPKTSVPPPPSSVAPAPIPPASPKKKPIERGEPVRRSTREKKAPERLVFLSTPIPPPEILPPKTLGEARKSPFWPGFEEAISSEISSLEKNQTWEYIDLKSLSRGTNVLRSKFVFDIKRDNF